MYKLDEGERNNQITEILWIASTIWENVEIIQPNQIDSKIFQKLNTSTIKRIEIK